jgi:polyphosphate glucokinase
VRKKAVDSTTPIPPARSAVPAAEAIPTTILVIDVGGTKVKLLATGQTEPRKFRSGPKITPAALVAQVQAFSQDWTYEAVSIGYPGLVGQHGPQAEPSSLGSGWVGFDFAAAFGRPVRILNDAALQALGSYSGGRMLFLGLGTGLGSALIADQIIVPLELGQLQYKNGLSLSDMIGRRGLKRFGERAWRQAVKKMVVTLMHAFFADSVVVGGGNATKLKKLPPGVRLGHNLTAFRGGFRLWGIEDVPTLSPDGEQYQPVSPPTSWRVI